MPDLDSYMLIEKDEEDTQRMVAVCVECRESHYPEVGWYYEGSKEGYSDYLWECHKCGKVIHDPDEEEA